MWQSCKIIIFTFILFAINTSALGQNEESFIYNFFQKLPYKVYFWSRPFQDDYELSRNPDTTFFTVQIRDKNNSENKRFLLLKSTVYTNKNKFFYFTPLKSDSSAKIELLTPNSTQISWDTNFQRYAKHASEVITNNTNISAFSKRFRLYREDVQKEKSYEPGSYLKYIALGVATTGLLYFAGNNEENISATKTLAIINGGLTLGLSVGLVVEHFKHKKRVDRIRVFEEEMEDLQDKKY